MRSSISAGPTERFSAADVYVGSHVGWGLLMGTIEKRPTFAEYWARLEHREARQRAEAIDNAGSAGIAQ